VIRAQGLKKLDIAAERIRNNVLIGKLDLAPASAALDAFADWRKLFVFEIFLDHAKSAVAR
jgi:hypothetical protein